MNDMALPANINVAGARLPETYEAAKVALTKCNNIDECVDWADKAAALASYAKQSEDDTLERMAMRIRGRAVRRAGELLQQIAPARGANQNIMASGGHKVLSRKDAGEAAGMSERQIKTAVRVANVPTEDFERAVESEDKVTVTELATMGKQTGPAPDYRQGRPTEQFQAATHTVGAMRRFAEKCAEHDAAYVAAGVLPHEVSEARSLVASLDAWLDRFAVHLKG